MDYVYFVLIHTIVVVYTTWCWCLEDESLIYTMLDYLFHIVEYVVFPILDLICVDFYNKKKFTLESSKSTHPPPNSLKNYCSYVCVYTPNVLWCGYQIVVLIMDILKGDEHLNIKGEGWKLTIYLHDHITLWSWMNMKGTWLNFVVTYNMEPLYLLALYFQKERFTWFRP
jgi:hypothetical protein